MTTSPDDDLDFGADLEAALDAQGAPPPAIEQDDTDGAGEEPALYRRDGRRFTRAEDAKPATQPDPQDAAPAAQQQQPTQPQGWRPKWLKDEHGLKWEESPEAFRKALEDREKEFAQEIERRAAPMKNWQQVEDRFKPYAQQMQASGLTTQQVVGDLLGAYERLISVGQNGQPDWGSRVSTLDQLCQQFTGRDLLALAYELQQQNYEPPAAPNPLEQKLAAVERELASLREAPLVEKKAAIDRTISEWSKDKPHYAELERTILGFIQADPSVRERFSVDPKATLDSLYEQAEWAHPELRQERLQQQEAQRLEQAKRAKAAGAQSPRGVPSPNGAQRPQKRKAWDIEADLAEAFDEAGVG